MKRALLTMLLVVGCAGDKYTVITVDARPAVTGASQLVVTLSNGGTSRMDKLPLGSHGFPVTFSVSAPGRAGDLDIKVEAQTSDGIDVGVGSGSAMIGDATANVMLDTADFVVNTDYAMDQFLAQDYEANGLQLAATNNGHWTAAFRDSCNQGACTVYGRSFDQNGVPASTVAAAGTNSFAFSSTLTTQQAMPAVAASGTSVLAFWDYYDTTGTGHGVACRALDASGNLTSGQLAVATDEADTVTATQLSNNNVAVTWQIYTPSNAIRYVIVKPDCTALGNVGSVSTTVGATSGPHRSHVASNGNVVLYAWLQDGDVHIRTGTNALVSGNDTTLITHTATQDVEAVRVAPMGTGFALAARWISTAGGGPGKIELFQVSSAGQLVGSAQLVTDQSLSDFASGEQSFGIGTNGQSLTLIAWHVCDSSGSTCDVFGRLANSDGTMHGETFMIPTTTQGDQTSPSVVGLPMGFAVAWNDTSHVAPDTQGSAVRARIIYPQ
ncbi:MAG: hypothetical protein JO257_23360 [Deltaproteobacteria bacterium]|nr:hypothetical protein [Deltaproteobacteria bacterium]